MGVSGAGKTTLGVRIAEALGWSFVEGDTLHPPENIDKMRGGIALTDADRAPWLTSIGDRIEQERTAGRSIVITCSALRRTYRDRIAAAQTGAFFIYLTADRRVLSGRLSRRVGHYMPASLLDSQLATLEEPDSDEPCLRVRTDTGVNPEAILSELRAQGVIA